MSQTLLDRAAAILRMKTTGLSLDWLKTFSSSRRGRIKKAASAAKEGKTLLQ